MCTIAATGTTPHTATTGCSRLCQTISLALYHRGRSARLNRHYRGPQALLYQHRSLVGGRVIAAVPELQCSEFATREQHDPPRRVPELQCSEFATREQHDPPRVAARLTHTTRRCLSFLSLCLDPKSISNYHHRHHHHRRRQHHHSRSGQLHKQAA